MNSKANLLITCMTDASGVKIQQSSRIWQLYPPVKAAEQQNTGLSCKLANMTIGNKYRSSRPILHHHFCDVILGFAPETAKLTGQLNIFFDQCVKYLASFLCVHRLRWYQATTISHRYSLIHTYMLLLMVLHHLWCPVAHEHQQISSPPPCHPDKALICYCTGGLKRWGKVKKQGCRGSMKQRRSLCWRQRALDIQSHYSPAVITHTQICAEELLGCLALVVM